MTDRPPGEPMVNPVKPARRGWRWHIFAPVTALALLFAAYSIYWFSVAGEVRTAVEEFAARPGQGLVVGWRDFTVNGYPYRIEAGFENPAMSAPAAPESWAWQGEAAEFALLPYNPRHLIVNLRGEQRFSYRDTRTAPPSPNEVRASAGTAWGSYVDIRDAPFGRLAIDIKDLDARHSRGATGETDGLTALRLQLHARPAERENAAPVPGSYDVAIQADDITLANGKTIAALGGHVERVMAQARLRDVPATPHASAVELLQNWQETGGTLAISDLVVKWGPLDLFASGELKLDALHRPEGQLDAKVTGFEALLEAMVRDRLVKEKDARIALAGLTLVSQFQGNRTDQVSVPVIMRNGRLYLGPLVVAALEPLY